MSQPRQHPVRRCAPCDIDWPAKPEYNLCPRCQRNTYASTDAAIPNDAAAAKEAARYERVREFDAQCDAAALKRGDDWAIEWNALLALTPSIPDPSTSPQSPTYFDKDANA